MSKAVREKRHHRISLNFQKECSKCSDIQEKPALFYTEDHPRGFGSAWAIMWCKPRDYFRRLCRGVWALDHGEFSFRHSDVWSGFVGFENCFIFTSFQHNSREWGSQQASQAKYIDWSEKSGVNIWLRAIPHLTEARGRSPFRSIRYMDWPEKVFMLHKCLPFQSFPVWWAVTIWPDINLSEV